MQSVAKYHLFQQLACSYTAISFPEVCQCEHKCFAQETAPIHSLLGARAVYDYLKESICRKGGLCQSAFCIQNTLYFHVHQPFSRVSALVRSQDAVWIPGRDGYQDFLHKNKIILHLLSHSFALLFHSRRYQHYKSLLL